MTTYTLDSNTVSYILRNEGKVAEHFQEEIVETGSLYAIPLIVVYEVKRWLLYKPNRMLRIFEQEFDALCRSVSDAAAMPSDVWEKAADFQIA